MKRYTSQAILPAAGFLAGFFPWREGAVDRRAAWRGGRCQDWRCEDWLGLAGLLALTRVIASALWGVTATDPITFAAVSLFLAAVALLACFIPARQAASIDPTVALRSK